MQPLKIAYVLTQNSGGPVDVCINLAYALSTSGAAAVRIFGPEPARRAERVKQVLHPVDIPRKTDLVAMRRMQKAIREWRPDVVHGQDRRAGLVTAAVRRLLPSHVALLHTYHGVPDDVSEPWFRRAVGAARPSLYTRAVLAGDSLVARSLDCTVVPSAAMEAFLRHRLRVPSARLEQIDNGVELPLPTLRDRPIRTLLFVGMLIKRKGVAQLLDALELPGTMPLDARLVVVGDGPERRALEARVASSPLRQQVDFLGFRTDIQTLMAGADAVVLPSLMEQQPVVLLEAMASGRPIVATDTGGVAELLDVPGATARLASPGDVHDLSVKLRDLFSEQDPLRTGAVLAENARARFSIERMAEAHVRLYNRLVHGPRESTYTSA